MKRALGSLVLGCMAAGVAVGLMLGVLAVMGYPAGAVAREWATGAAGTWEDFATSLKEACPLLLTGLAAGVAFRCGVLNIGAEGQFLLGGITAIGMTTRFAPPGLPAWMGIVIACGVGMLAGAIWAGVAAVLERYRGVPLVLSTILLNFVALYVLRVLVTGILQAPGRGAHSLEVPEKLQLPILLEGTDLHVGVIVAGVVAVAVWVVMARTRFGFELLLTGQNARAAELAGVRVRRRAVEVMLLSGAIAGLGGSLQALGVTHGLTDDPASFGYAGIAVALLGRLHPLGIVLAAMFFGMLERGASFAEPTVPHHVADVIKGVVILVTLGATAWVVGRTKGAVRGG